MVYIEKLVCKGFKSFGRDTVTIKLDPGFTCIVGPNGAGKSNVIDAILFVLGQLSAKTLRATVFSDLLYSPPKPDMPPKAKSAVVEIHFNNRDRRLQVDTDKVVVERELDDTGKSVCRVNGKIVTRLQVLDLLGSIGVDPNGYNLVLQGEIAQMVKVSPNDRRKLIEEIAGISAYDEQKERALKKLSESEGNLARVETQLQERRRQLEKLETERSDALRYQGVKQKIQSIRIDSLAWTLLKSTNRIATIDHTLAEKAQEIERTSQEFAHVEESIVSTEHEIEAIDQEIEQITGGNSARVSEHYGVLSAAVAHVRESLERAKETLRRSVEERTSLEQELKSTRNQIEESSKARHSKEQELVDLDREIEKTVMEMGRLEESLQREQTTFYETQQRLQDLNNQAIALDEGISEVRSAMRSDEKELGLAYEELRDSEESLKRTGEEMALLAQMLPAKREELSTSETLEAAKRSEVEDISKRLITVNSQVDESVRLVNVTREELIKLQARQEALKEAEEAFLKREKAVARVLEMRDTGEVQGIHGTVAELGKIDPEYSVALEIAGGNRLTYIVVDDEQVATECIRVLKKEKVGRASFIPLTRIKSKSPGHVPDDERVIGYAMDLVSFEPRYLPAFEFVFVDTIVTEDFETAKRMGFKGWRAVSIDGDLVERSGLITGGHYHRGKSGISLQVQDNSSEIMEKLKGLEQILSDLRTQQTELRNREKQTDREIQQLSKKIYQLRIETKGLEDQLEEKRARQEKLTQRISQLRLTIEELESQIATLRERDTEMSGRRESVRSQRDEMREALAKSAASRLTQDIKDLQEVLAFSRKKRETYHSELTRLQVGVEQRLIPKAQELESRIQTVESVIPNMQAEVEKQTVELSQKEAELEELRTQRERIEEAVKDRRVRQIQLKEDLRNLRLRLEELREAQTSNEKAVYRLQTERSRIEADIVGIRAELAAVTDPDEELTKRMSQRELSHSEIEQLQEKIRELERELEAMGAVNLKSLTDYDAERERYDEIVERKVKLEEEHKEILSFMEELEREKTRKFLVVYNEIADNFAKVFAKLSPGGEASLMLENPEHPLMGGITVRSKPAGKELVTLDAMSGGEKTLTGLALIFAIQMHSPASFYVFDEIDAALDEVNAHNVANLISEMSKSSQFIVVSLRDTTVAKADFLVGVTNQDGLSRIVDVDLQEVSQTS